MLYGNSVVSDINGKNWIPKHTILLMA